MYRHTKAYYEHLHSQIITYALTDMHGHVCEHRLTSRHTDTNENSGSLTAKMQPVHRVD
jgi:hypothetical protein